MKLYDEYIIHQNSLFSHKTVLYSVKTTFPHKILRVKRITGKVNFSDETTGARGTDHPPFF